MKKSAFFRWSSRDCGRLPLTLSPVVSDAVHEGDGGQRRVETLAARVRVGPAAGDVDDLGVEDITHEEDLVVLERQGAVDVDGERREALGEHDAFLERLDDFFVIQAIRRRIHHSLSVAQRDTAP